VFQLIANILSWFYEITHSYAAAIGLLTLSVMVLLTPLTLKGTKSMIQMQRLQPEIKRLQAQYKGDRQRMNEEMMRFYQENKINPLSGCLPLLIQAPVFAILYRVIHKLTETDSQGKFNPSYISHNSELYKALKGSTSMKSFGIDLSQSTVKAIQNSFGHAIPYLVLVFLVGLTSWFQQRQIMARNTGQVVNPQQQMLMKFIPFVWPVILLNLPTGLAVYGLVSNLYRIAQQGYITRALYRPHHVSGVIEAKVVEDDQPKRPPRKGGGSGANGTGSKQTPAPKGEAPRPPKPTPSRVTPPKAKPKPKPSPTGRVGRPPDRRKK
jgi:YidC/Oxa1 family membrane protein insertase